MTLTAPPAAPTLTVVGDCSAPTATVAAQVRTRVTVPLQLADGYATSADVFTFTGLVDGQEHLALGLGDWRGAAEGMPAGGAAPPLVRPHSECLTGDVLGSVRTGVHQSAANVRYLRAKREHTAHSLDLAAL